MKATALFLTLLSIGIPVCCATRLSALPPKLCPKPQASTESLLEIQQFGHTEAQLEPRFLDNVGMVVPAGLRAKCHWAVQDTTFHVHPDCDVTYLSRNTHCEHESCRSMPFEEHIAQTGSQAPLIRPHADIGSFPTNRATRPIDVQIADSAPYLNLWRKPSPINVLVIQDPGYLPGPLPVYSGVDIAASEIQAATIAQSAALWRPEPEQETCPAGRQLSVNFGRHVPVAPHRARLSLDNVEIDAGDVTRGAVAHFVFTIRNTGDATLDLSAKPSCGCTVARIDKFVAPGGAGKLEAKLDTAAFRGRIFKTVDLTSNDPERPHTTLQLSANVLSMVQVLPTDIHHILLKSAMPTIEEIQIRTGGNPPVEISRVTSSATYAAVQLEQIRPAAGTGRIYKLRLTVQPDAPLGRSVVILTAYTTAPFEPMVMITAVCDNGILAVPVSLYLGALTVAPPLPVTQVVTLTKSEGMFHVLRVKNVDSSLLVQTQTRQEGSQYILTVTYKGGWPAGLVRSKIIVETDDPRQPSIEIPIRATVTGRGE